MAHLFGHPCTRFGPPPLRLRMVNIIFNTSNDWRAARTLMRSEEEEDIFVQAMHVQQLCQEEGRSPAAADPFRSSLHPTVVVISDLQIWKRNVECLRCKTNNMESASICNCLKEVA